MSGAACRQAGWGTTNLTVALQHMLRVALLEPRNQRFVLLSESGVPLYPPAVVWQSLMGEPRSRVDACLVNWNWWLMPPKVRKMTPCFCRCSIRIFR